MRPGRPIMRRCRPIDIIFGCVLAFRPQRVEGVGRVVGEVARRHEAVEALVIVHVVGVEAVGQHQVPLARDLDEERQVVGIVVAVVEEAAFLDQQAARVGRGRGAGVPADGPRARRSRSAPSPFDRLPALRRFLHVGMLLPAPAVAGDLMAAFHRILDEPGRELGGLAAGADRGWHAEPLAACRRCRHQAALVPYSKCDSMQRSGTPKTSSVTS